MEFTATSGAKVKIGSGDFEDVMDLQAAIMKQISGSEFSLNGFDLEEELDIAEFLKIGMSVASSKEIRELIFKCLTRCTYNGDKITKQTFEDVGARGDFYEVSFACLKENLTPFFAPLLSKLKPLIGKVREMVEESQK